MNSFKKSLLTLSLMILTPMAFAGNSIQAGEYLNSHNVTDLEGEVGGVQDSLVIQSATPNAILKKVQIYTMADGGNSCSVEEVFTSTTRGTLEFEQNLKNFDGQVCHLILRKLSATQVELIDVNDGCQIEMCGHASLNRIKFNKVLND